MYISFKTHQHKAAGMKTTKECITAATANSLICRHLLKRDPFSCCRAMDIMCLRQQNVVVTIIKKTGMTKC